MSLRGNIDHLATAQGITAVAVQGSDQSELFRGEEAWKSVLETSRRLLGLTQESSVRLVIGAHTVVVQREGSEVVGVVLPTGHAVAKSLRRMIRRMAKKDRGPVVATSMAAIEQGVAPAPGQAPERSAIAPSESSRLY